MIKITDLNLRDKIVLIRADLNVPIVNNQITSDMRIESALPTIKFALESNARVVIASHFGRPIEGQYDNKFSLLPVVQCLKQKLGIPISFVREYLNGVKICRNELTILENVRFNKGETSNDRTLSQKYANLCDIFVMDAFGVAHRMHASTYGVTKFASIACAGQLLISELEILNKLMSNPNRPMIAIIGGSKISSKLNLLNNLAKIADTIFVGGGIANTFIAVNNNVGQSLYDSNFIKVASFLKERYNFYIPTDCYVSKEYSEYAVTNIKKVNNISDDEIIVDLGDESINYITNYIQKKAKTILWNGPVGLFEFSNFSRGTRLIAESIAKSSAVSVIGGGDTVSVIDKFKLKKDISYISTGGGSFLKLIEGKKLPAVSALEK